MVAESLEGRLREEVPGNLGDEPDFGEEDGAVRGVDDGLSSVGSSDGGSVPDVDGSVEGCEASEVLSSADHRDGGARVEDDRGRGERDVGSDQESVSRDVGWLKIAEAVGEVRREVVCRSNVSFLLSILRLPSALLPSVPIPPPLPPLPLDVLERLAVLRVVSAGVVESAPDCGLCRFGGWLSSSWGGGSEESVGGGGEDLTGLDLVVVLPEFVEDGLGGDGGGESLEAGEDETELDVFVGGGEVRLEHDGEEPVADQDLLVVRPGGSDDGDVLVPGVDPLEKLGRGERSGHDATNRLGEIGWGSSGEASLEPVEEGLGLIVRLRFGGEEGVEELEANGAVHGGVEAGSSLIFEEETLLLPFLGFVGRRSSCLDCSPHPLLSRPGSVALEPVGVV